MLFNGFLRALPGDRACLSPSSAVLPADLTPASRRQDHTTSPSASARFVKRAARVHRIPRPTSVTIAKRPSVGRDGAGFRSDLGQARSRIFFETGLDNPNHLEGAGVFALTPRAADLRPARGRTTLRPDAPARSFPPHQR